MLLLFFLACNTPQQNGNTQVSVDYKDTNYSYLPTKMGSWQEPPLVINCINQTLYSRPEIVTALKLNKFEVLDVIDMNCDDFCVAGPDTVLISSNSCGNTQKNSISNLSITNKTIESVSVHIFKRHPLILRHELNHANGWTDASMVGHIQNPLLDAMGTSTEGM